MSHLTPSQEFHNRMLDFEIQEAERHNKFVEEQNRLKIERWNKFLEQNPDHPFKSCPNLDIRSPKRVIGLRYV